jgi:RIO-like serine/threonine protein kinase
MRWLGRRLAARESGFMERLAGIEGIPRSLGPISRDGKVLDHAVSREWIPGHALVPAERVDAAFFPTFRRLLAAVHARDVAHVDLHKRENILVDEHGRPWLIDFQISLALPQKDRFAAMLLRGMLRVFQRCDEYHILKHEMNHRPDDAAATWAEIQRCRPWWIRAHRCVAVPFRRVRRGLLVALGIRSSGGQASSEAFPEIAHRLPGAMPLASRRAG